MYKSLETAEAKENLKRIVIDPVTRVEGHGKVTLLLDEENHVQQARLHIVEFRGFERFIQGRPYWELPVLVQRLCGICPVSHHLAAAKAIDQLPPKQRAVFILKRQEGLSLEEIAQILGRSVGTIKAHLHHATHKLIDLLGPYLEE